MGRLLISFSGGETSALMAKLIRARWHNRYAEIITVFSNTGQENEETLQFVDRCDREFGLNVVWIEAVTNPERGQGVKARVVDLATADRSGAAFEAMIAKHGIPGPGFIHCTRELKERPITAYARSIGWGAGTYDTAIGIRIDEIDRMRMAGLRVLAVRTPSTSVFQVMPSLVSRNHSPWKRNRRVITDCATASDCSFQKLAAPPPKT